MSDDEFEFLGLDKKELLGVGNLAGHYANNQKLKDIQGRGPACPHCRGNLADSGVKVCMHCGRDVVWDYGRALTPAEARELIEARKTAEKQVYFLFRSTRLETNPEQIKKNFDSAIALMESVLDRDRVESLREAKKSHLKRTKEQWSEKRKADKVVARKAAKIAARKADEPDRRQRNADLKLYGLAQRKKENKRDTLAFMPIPIAMCYALYAIPCWLLSLMGFDPWFWSSIPSWAHYSLLVGCPILTVVLCVYFSYRSKAERKAILLEKESKSESDNQKKAKNPTKKEDAHTQPVAYYLKRGETIRGPLERAAILQAATGKKLLSGDQIANTKAGPWQDITKEQLEQMQQGSDVMIRWLVPPQDREVLKKWLRSIGDQPSVSCPYCDISIKRSNLLKHCDKLHPINAS